MLKYHVCLSCHKGVNLPSGYDSCSCSARKLSKFKFTLDTFELELIGKRVICINCGLSKDMCEEAHYDCHKGFVHEWNEEGV